MKIPQAEVAVFCRKWQVREIALFGSVLREDFGPGSDVDIMVEFLPGATWGLFDLTDMEAELSRLFSRPVDLVDRASVEASENYIRRDHALKSLERIYVEG